MEPAVISYERENETWLDTPGGGCRKKPLIAMRESLAAQHRRIGDSLEEVHRLLGEAEIVREDLAPSERPLRTLSWVVALPFAFMFVPVAIFLLLRESVHPTPQPPRLGPMFPRRALRAPRAQRLRSGRRPS